MRIANPKRVSLVLLFIGLFGLSWFSGARSPASIPPPAVPDNLKVPDGQLVLLKALGKGVQIYGCQANSKDPSKFEWALKAPEAVLLNSKGNRIGKHYAGPTWEASDGSKILRDKSVAVKSAPSAEPKSDKIGRAHV